MVSVFKSFTSEQKPTTSYTVSEGCHVQSNLKLPGLDFYTKRNVSTLRVFLSRDNNKE